MRLSSRRSREIGKPLSGAASIERYQIKGMKTLKCAASFRVTSRKGPIEWWLKTRATELNVHKKVSASSRIVVRRTEVQIGVSSQEVVTQPRECGASRKTRNSSMDREGSGFLNLFFFADSILHSDPPTVRGCEVEKR